MKAIMTVIGPDHVGIIAGVTTLLASLNLNILDLSQTVFFGELSLDGKIKQPFEYTHAEEIGGGWMVSKDDRNYGIIIPDGTLAIPLKYNGFWSWNDGPLMWRHDGKLDVYDEDYKFVRTDPEPKID